MPFLINNNNKQDYSQAAFSPLCLHYAECLPTFRFTFLQRTILGVPRLCHVQVSTQNGYSFWGQMILPPLSCLGPVMGVGHSIPFLFLTTEWIQSGQIIPSYSLATEVGPGMALGLELRPVREAGIRL